MFFSVYTLGCKLNQLETEAITDSFSREGFTFVPWDSAERGSPLSASNEILPEEPRSGEPLLLVINTCTVTSMAEQKARRIIRKALRDHPLSCLIVTGCYAQMESAALQAMEEEPGRLFVVPGDKKDRILDLPHFLAAAGILPGQGLAHAGYKADFPAPSLLPGLIAAWIASFGNNQKEGDGAFRFQPEDFFSHSRGFLKIQDGCDHHCSYCRVSLARGKSRSLRAREVLAALRSLQQRGFTEAILTGVNITQYRDSELASPGLPGLLEFLLEETRYIRLRLSSIEPDGLKTSQWSGDFIRVLANPRIRPHFHLSVQSGSAGILAKMGRGYTPEDIEKTIALLRSVRDDPFLACDIIAGFPGETERDFQQTLELCESSGFAWIHAFAFSRRPGTAAYDLPGRVNEKDAARRVELLTALAREGRRDYILRWKGKEVEAVIEKGEGLPHGFAPGVSENYLKLLIACGGESAPAPGSLVRCRILHDQDIQFTQQGQIDALAEKTGICSGQQKVI